MDSSVSPKDEICFLRVCHHISTGLYSASQGICRLTAGIRRTGVWLGPRAGLEKRKSFRPCRESNLDSKDESKTWENGLFVQPMFSAASPSDYQAVTCISWNPTIHLSKVKVKWCRYRSGVAQRVGRGIALLFYDRGTRRRWVVSSTPRPHFNPVKDPVPILQEAGWAPGPVWTGGKSRPHWDSIPDRPALSRYSDWATGPTI